MLLDSNRLNTKALNSILWSFGVGALLFIMGCGQSKQEETVSNEPNAEIANSEESNSETQDNNIDLRSNPAEFIPSGFSLFEKIMGDLNGDGVDDCVLIIKGTDKSKIVVDEYRGELDRNRRGILVLLNNQNKYQLSVSNLDCFSSENEDGGVYFAPELSLEIRKGNLYVQYGHGRYGSWSYTLRFQGSDLELIGYDSSNGGPVIESETSINFLTKKKLKKVNTNENATGGDEVFEDKWSTIKIDRLFLLSNIKDFDDLQVKMLNY